jgi:hypothetical protein
MQVEQDDVRPLSEPHARLAQGRRLADAKALQLEVEPAEQTKRLVVLDEEHGHLTLSHGVNGNERPGRSGYDRSR